MIAKILTVCSVLFGIVVGASNKRPNPFEYPDGRSGASNPFAEDLFDISEGDTDLDSPRALNTPPPLDSERHPFSREPSSDDRPRMPDPSVQQSFDFVQQSFDFVQQSFEQTASDSSTTRPTLYSSMSHDYDQSGPAGGQEVPRTPSSGGSTQTSAVGGTSIDELLADANIAQYIDSFGANIAEILEQEDASVTSPPATTTQVPSNNVANDGTVASIDELMASDMFATTDTTTTDTSSGEDASNLLIRVFELTLQTCTSGGKLRPYASLPACCSIAKTIHASIKCEKMVLFVAFLEMLTNVIKTNNIPYSPLRKELLTIFEAVLRPIPRRKAGSLAYLLSTLLSRNKSSILAQDIATSFKASYNVEGRASLPKVGLDIEDLNEQVILDGNKVDVPTIYPAEGGDYRAAKAFFERKTPLFNKRGVVYAHIVNLFRSPEIKGKILENFAQGCTDEDFKNYFEQLYDAFFNPALHFELAEMSVDVLQLGTTFFASEPGKGHETKPHHFYSKTYLWKAVAKLSSRIQCTPELFGKPTLHLPITPTTQSPVGNLTYYLALVPDMNAAIEHADSMGLMGGACDCAKALEVISNLDPSLSVESSQAQYAILNVSSELVKVNHCILMILALFLGPRNPQAVVKGLEETLKQMAVHNLDVASTGKWISDMLERLRARGAVR